MLLDFELGLAISFVGDFAATEGPDGFTALSAGTFLGADFEGVATAIRFTRGTKSSIESSELISLRFARLLLEATRDDLAWVATLRRLLFRFESDDDEAGLELCVAATFGIATAGVGPAVFRLLDDGDFELEFDRATLGAVCTGVGKGPAELVVRCDVRVREGRVTLLDTLLERAAAEGSWIGALDLEARLAD